MDLLLTGRWMDAAEAHRWGLVNEVLPKDRLEERVRETARLLASGPPLVFAAIKEVAREAEASFRDAMNRITRRQFRTVDELYGSEDSRVRRKARSGLEGALTGPGPFAASAAIADRAAGHGRHWFCQFAKLTFALRLPA